MDPKGQGRRRCFAQMVSIAATLAAPRLAFAQPGGLAADSIVFGHSGDLTGPLRDLGTEVLKGAQFYFDALNARGGVHGRKVKLLPKDDAYDPQRTLMNVNGYVEGDDVFALFGVFGTPNN